MKEYKKPDKDELLHKLTPLQYKVTQENRTERPFEKEGYGEYLKLFNK